MTPLTFPWWKAHNIMATTKTNTELMEEIERLKGQLKDVNEARTEEQALAAATSAASAFNGSAEEQATGKTVKVKRCVNPTETDAKQQEFKSFNEPTFFYTVDLPIGSAGSEGAFLSTNGDRYYHGMTYELTHDQLVDLKSRVHNAWKHEKSTQGTNENAYRKQTQRHFGKRG